ncbi:site-specific integrase [Halorhodospira sp. 9621]|uniref:tyrosine-type recombinase/integrase n=1 Tax=Halorhodospira sp. 9621 TaxID=2899135 RepID=UPI001EE9007B|nr:site-specific integrase [Halorhodospira sp. 9621]
MTELTDKKVREAEPPARGRRIIFDRHREAPKGFGLRINASGRRGFVLRYLHHGRDRLVSIGDYPIWTLKAAREQAAKMRREVDGGTDLLEERRRERAEPTVDDLLDEYLEVRMGGLSSARRAADIFRLHVRPAIGRRRVSTVRRGDLVPIMERQAQAGNGRQAALTLQYLRAAMDLAVDREYIQGNPLAGLKPGRVHPAMRPKTRNRVLSEGEMRGLWSVTRAPGIEPLTALALKLVLITGQRPGEVLGLHETEMSGEWWTIPGSRRGKTEDDHRVYLTETARELIAKARELSRDEGYLFASAPRRPISAQALSKAAKRAAEPLANEEDPTWGHWRPHDLRRTARTGMAAAGVAEIVAELTIGHTRKGIAAVYDAHRYENEKAAALQAWEKRFFYLIGGVKNDAKVIDFQGVQK